MIRGPRHITIKLRLPLENLQTFFFALSNKVSINTNKGMAQVLYHGARGLLRACLEISSSWRLKLTSFLRAAGRLRGGRLHLSRGYVLAKHCALGRRLRLSRPAVALVPLWCLSFMVTVVGMADLAPPPTPLISGLLVFPLPCVQKLLRTALLL